MTKTDPLDGDSDSPETLEDEAGNGVPDGQEDFDNDGLDTATEFSLGTDPFNQDTDGDGLSDKWETRITRTDPLDIDSDGDGVPDGEEDPDNDTLTNLEEQDIPSNPLANDTDGDGLTDDAEVRELGTSPIRNDTDEDGLEDATELKTAFGTDPTDPDTDGDGVLDGDETYRQTVANESVGASITLDSSEDRSGTFRFNDASDEPALKGVAKGSAADVETSRDFDEATLTLSYDESSLGNTSESDLGIAYYNETSHRLEPVENQHVNTSGDTVEATVTHLSTYTVIDLENYVKTFLDTNDPHDPRFSKGETLRIKAKIHNVNDAAAEDVEVQFYEGGEPGSGDLIGTDTLPEVQGHDWTQASTTWTVPEDQYIDIYVEADPDDVIAESDETNNGALRSLGLKALDSDGDGLSDYDEINGMRTAMGLTVKTDPRDPDTDGDGLNDGKEMGRLNTYRSGSLSGERYYYLQSYPSTDVEGAVVTDSVDSDGDGLDDLAEYDFGSDGMNRDTDGDGLSDFMEWQEGTHPLKSDTDRDGLTDWAEVEDHGTDPLNPDTDEDGKMDGDEVVIHETDPNEYTYFVEVFVVADEEFRDYYRLPYSEESAWRNVASNAVETTGEHFSDQFEVKLVVTEMNGNWNSDKNNFTARNLLTEAGSDFSWAGVEGGEKSYDSDILIAFTGQNPLAYFSGDTFGMADNSTASAINRIVPAGPASSSLLSNLVQHEVSHLFGAPDHRDGRDCVMDKTYPTNSDFMDDVWGNLGGNMWMTNKWGEDCKEVIESNRAEISRFSEEGIHPIPVEWDL